MAAYIFDRFPAAVRALAARCKLSVALRPGLSREDLTHTKEMTNESTKESGPRPLLLFCGRHEGGHGQEQRSLNLGAQLLRFRSPLLFSFLPIPELPL
jgi:hypothetical protein